MDAVPKSVKHLSEEITFAKGNNKYFFLILDTLAVTPVGQSVQWFIVSDITYIQI